MPKIIEETYIYLVFFLRKHIPLSFVTKLDLNYAIKFYLFSGI